MFLRPLKIDTSHCNCLSNVLNPVGHAETLSISIFLMVFFRGGSQPKYVQSMSWRWMYRFSVGFSSPILSYFIKISMGIKGVVLKRSAVPSFSHMFSVHYSDDPFIMNNVCILTSIRRSFGIWDPTLAAEKKQMGNCSRKYGRGEEKKPFTYLSVNDGFLSTDLLIPLHVEYRVKSKKILDSSLNLAKKGSFFL